MSTDIAADSAKDAANIRLRRNLLSTALCVAAVANVLIPAVLFSVTQFFGPTDPRYRTLVDIVVVGEYAIAFLLLLWHANVGFAAGYTFATAATVTLGSAVLAPTNLTTPWHMRRTYERVAHVNRMIYEDCEGEERNPIVNGHFTLAPPPR